MLKDVEETTAWMRDTVQAWNDWPLDRLSVDAGGLLEKVNEDKLARDVDDLSSIFEDLADGGDFALPCDDLETGCEVASGWIDGLDNSDGLDADVLNINELSAEFDVLVAEQDAEIEKTVASESSDADESMTESASEYDDDEDMEDVDDEEEVPSKPCSILVPSKIVPAAPVWVMSAPLDPRSCIRTAVFKNVDSRIPRISIPRMDLALADQTSSVAKHPLAALQTARLPTQTQDKQVKKCQVPEYKHNPSTCWICKSDKTPEKKRALHRFLEKRSRRNWKRGPRYSGRSHVAASRVRNGGRFICTTQWI